jgi:hypothetical protein
VRKRKLKVIFSVDASQVLSELEEDPKNEDLLKAIWDTIDVITRNPGSAASRRRAIRTPRDHPVWLVPIPEYPDDDRWVLLWQPRGDDVLIPYIGPEDFRSGYS